MKKKLKPVGEQSTFAKLGQEITAIRKSLGLRKIMLRGNKKYGSVKKRREALLLLKDKQRVRRQIMRKRKKGKSKR